MNLGLIFVTGLTTGGLTCAAMQAGLLSSLMAQQKKEEELELPEKSNESVSFSRRDQQSLSIFLLAKLLAHVIFGALLGWLGSALQLSLWVQLTMQVLAALFLFVSAANLIDLHPAFRWFVFTPPKWSRRWLRSSTQSQSWLAPAVLGALTIFIPCGVTQSMMVLALSTGSPIWGALVMGIFILGTTPVFATIGLATATLAHHWQKKFLTVAAAFLMILSLQHVNGVLVVLNAPITLQKLARPVTYFFSAERFRAKAHTATAPVIDGKQQLQILVTKDGYSAPISRVRVGQPVELTIESRGTTNCANAFTFPAFGIQANLKPTDKKVFTFTPKAPGTYQYACSMGMFTGVVEVVS